jgi:hypothetical protein
MKKSVAALGVAVIVTLGAASAARAAVSVIDFGGASSGPVSFTAGTGSNLNASTALNLSGATEAVSTVGSDDTTGITAGTLVTIFPLNIAYGSGDGPEAIDLSKAWTVGGTSYTETLSEVTITRTALNSITLSFTGDVSGGAFVDTPAMLILNASQARGPGEGHAVSVSFTDAAATGAIPESSTWVMMLLGFAGLGFAVARRSAKNRTAVAF